MTHDNVFDFILQCIAQLIALIVEEFNPVIFHRVMGCGNHNTCIQSVFSYQIRNRRRGDHPCHNCVRADGADAGNQCAFQHIPTDTGIHSNQNTGGVLCFLCQHIRTGSA